VTTLEQCPRCGWYAESFGIGGVCAWCGHGWIACPTHGRLEHVGTDHRRVTVAEVLVAVPIASAGGGRG
jgi:hypothetical protein